LTCSVGRETMPGVLIVDAQVHIWGSGAPLPPHRPTAVFSPGWDPGSSELALEAARQHPDRLARS
jgi:hypothetical protein